MVYAPGESGRASHQPQHLLGEFADAVHTYLMRFTDGDTAAAAELTRQTFLRAGRRDGVVDDLADADPETRRAWLLALANQVAIEAGRERAAEAIASAPVSPAPVSPAPASPAASAEERMRELYAVHGRSLYLFLLGLTAGERQTAEDLTQETLLRAWRKLDILAADVKVLRPWLFTVARRLAIDAARARRARPASAGGADVEIMPALGDSYDQVLDAETLRNALAKLSPEHRQVIVEMYYRRCTVAEIAERVGLPVGTVKSRVYYALRALRTAMGTDPDGQPTR